LLPTVDISGTVILVYDIIMAGTGKETDNVQCLFFLQICSRIPRDFAISFIWKLLV